VKWKSGWKLEIVDTGLEGNYRFEGALLFRGDLISICFGATEKNMIRDAEDIKHQVELRQQGEANKKVIEL